MRERDLLCQARNQQAYVKTVRAELSNYDDNSHWRSKARVEDEIRCWSQKLDKTVEKLRSLVDQLDDHERQHLIKHSNHDLDIRMRSVGIELSWWKDRYDTPEWKSIDPQPEFVED
jgi:hypothetical protein